MKKQTRTIFIAAGIFLVLAVTSFVLWCVIPRQVELQTPGILIHGDGTAEVTQVQITGTWKPVLFDDTLREFSGILRVEKLEWLNREDILYSQIAFLEDTITDSGNLMGGDFIRQTGTLDTLGNIWVWTNRKMDGFVILATEDGAAEQVWIVVPAEDMEDALALRDSWGLPETVFNWGT